MNRLWMDMQMGKRSYIIGILMLLVGGYLFLQSMAIIMTGSILDSWMTWTLYLTFGIILVSFGPGVIVWSYTKNYQAAYRSLANQTQWQMVQLPKTCTSCGNEIEIHSLEWIGPNEARCPFCSNEIEVITSSY